MAAESIYDRIRFYIELSGVLPDDFEAEEREYKDKELRFVPGAMEGILGRHGQGFGDGEGLSLAETIKGYLKMAPKDALADFERREAENGRLASARRGICREILRIIPISARSTQREVPP